MISFGATSRSQPRPCPGIVDPVRLIACHPANHSRNPEPEEARWSLETTTHGDREETCAAQPYGVGFTGAIIRLGDGSPCPVLGWLAQPPPPAVRTLRS